MKIMTVRAPDDVQSKLTKSAKMQGLTRNALILFILNQWIKDEESNKRK